MEIVHLSDLDYTNGDPFQIALIDALFKDLEQQLKTGISPEVLVFSGDLVNNPDEKDIYASFEERFLKPLLATLELSSEQVILCPGNHDLSFASIRDRGMLYESLQTNGKKPEFLAEHCRKEELPEYARSVSKDFFELCSRYGGPWSNPFWHVYDFPTSNLAFVALNSAFSCSLKGSFEDRGKLLYPVDQALAAFQSVSKGRYVLSVAHHPINDFTDATSRTLVPIVEKRTGIHFFGHVHQPKPATTKSAVGDCFLVQSGALYETKDGEYNGYSIVRLSDDAAAYASAEYHTYYRDRQEFDVGTNVVKGGTFFSSEEAFRHFSRRIAPATDDNVAYWLMEHTDAVMRKFNSTLTERKLMATFVEPHIVRPRQDESGGSTDIDISFSLDDLIASTDHVVIAADHEFGSTALLQYLCMRLYQQCTEIKKPLVPVYLDARRLKPYENAITSAFKAELPETTEGSLKFQSLHDSGRLLALIDDFDPTNETHVQVIAALRVSFPKARLIIAAKLPLIYIEHLKPVVGIQKFLFLQLRPMTRGRVRLLVDRWGLPSGYESDFVVEEIVARFRRLGIPITPAHVVIYLSILSDVKGYNPVNSSSVIEQFVESVLDKYRPNFALRGAFDYRNQVDYLAAMAGRMCLQGEFVVDYSEFVKWTANYFDEIGIDQNCRSVIEMFHGNKIIAIEANAVCFRYNLYMSYFIAQRMLSSSEFREWILAEGRYTNYVAEIDLYCGLSRNDVAILEFLGEEFAKFNAQLAVLVAPLAWNSPLERLQLPRVSDQAEFAALISEQLLSDPMPAEKRDEALEAEDPPGRKNKPTLSRPDVQGILPNWILSLRAYTVALKNLENVPRATKEKHLTGVLDGWATVVRYACLLFRDLIDKPEITVGPMKFVLVLPTRPNNELLRYIFLSIPTAISHWVRSDLGSQKLEAQLRDDKLAPKLAMRFLQVGLYADMKLEGFIDHLRNFHEQIAESQLFMEALIVKMKDVYLRFGLTTEEQKSFQKLAAEVNADVKGLKGTERIASISKFGEKLRKSAQIAKLKDSRK